MRLLIIIAIFLFGTTTLSAQNNIDVEVFRYVSVTDNRNIPQVFQVITADTTGGVLSTSFSMTGLPMGWSPDGNALLIKTATQFQIYNAGENTLRPIDTHDDIFPYSIPYWSNDGQDVYLWVIKSNLIPSIFNLLQGNRTNNLQTPENNPFIILTQNDLFRAALSGVSFQIFHYNLSSQSTELIDVFPLLDESIVRFPFLSLDSFSGNEFGFSLLQFTFEGDITDGESIQVGFFTLEPYLFHLQERALLQLIEAQAQEGNIFVGWLETDEALIQTIHHEIFSPMLFNEENSNQLQTEMLQAASLNNTQLNVINTLNPQNRRVIETLQSYLPLTSLSSNFIIREDQLIVLREGISGSQFDFINTRTNMTRTVELPSLASDVRRELAFNISPGNQTIWGISKYHLSETRSGILGIGSYNATQSVQEAYSVDIATNQYQALSNSRREGESTIPQLLTLPMRPTIFPILPIPSAHWSSSENHIIFSEDFNDSFGDLEIVIYDTRDQTTIRLTNNTSPDHLLTWVDNGSLLFNGEFEIGEITIFESDIEAVIGVEPLLDFPNCEGTLAISDTYTFTKSYSSSINIETAIISGTSLNVGVDVGVEGIFSVSGGAEFYAEIENRLGRSAAHTFEMSRSRTLGAEAGTHVSYGSEWLLISQRLQVEIIRGNEIDYLIVRVPEMIDLRILPPTRHECP